MSKPYQVTVNDSLKIDVNTAAFEGADIIKISDRKFHVLFQNTSVEAEIISHNYQEKTYTILVNNNTYVVNLQDGLDKLIETLGFQTGGGKNVDKIKAPMPGLILEVAVKAGQEVNEDDPLLILEAMKMENSIRSPRSGIIKNVLVNTTETVEKNQLLIEFE